MRGVVTHIDYSVENNKDLRVRFYGRGEDRKRFLFTMNDTQPFFYVPADANVPKEPEVVSVVPGYMSIFGDPLKKINVRYPFDVPKLRNRMEHYEADILYEYRMRYEYGIKGQVEIHDNTITPIDVIGGVVPKFAFIDIEVDNSKAGWTPDVAEGEILSMAIYDLETSMTYILLNLDPHPARRNFPDISNDVFTVLDKSGFKDYKIKIVECDSEHNLLTRYKSYLSGPYAPDILAAWNGWKYDFPYLKKRLGRNNIRLNTGQSLFDYMYGYGTLYRTQHGALDSNALQSCASKELGTGKLKLDAPIHVVYRDDVAKFVAYNIIDVLLMYEIEKKIGVSKFYQTLSEVSGVAMDNINMATRISENMIFFSLRGTKIVLPSCPRQIRGREFRARGGEVFKPSKGIFENVIVLDLKGEYPNVMRSFNLSPETIYRGNSDTASFDLPMGRNTHSVKSPRGVVPKILDHMTSLRDEMKKEMKKYPKGTNEFDIAFSKQEAFKWIMNSFSGVLDNEHFRLANRILFNNITGISRKHIKWTAEKSKEMGYDVLYGDTDSILIQMHGKDYEEMIAKGKEIETELNASYKEFISQFNATESYLHVDLKKLYSKWFQGGKMKRYAGIVVWDGGKFIDPLIEITGFESKRSSTADWTRAIQKELLWKILTEKSDKVEGFLKQIHEDLKSKKVPIEELGIPVRLSSNKYKGNPIHYRASVYSNQYLGTDIRAGSKVKYYYVKSIKGCPPTDVAALDVDDDVPDIFNINMDEHIRRCFTLPLGPIAKAIGLDIDKIISGQQVLSLFDF